MNNKTHSRFGLPLSEKNITKLNSYDERLDSAADIAITDMLVRNFVALICHDLDANDPSLIVLE